MLSKQEKISGILLLIGCCIAVVAIHCFAYWDSVPNEHKIYFMRALWFVPMYFTLCCVHIGLCMIRGANNYTIEDCERELHKHYKFEYKNLEQK